MELKKSKDKYFKLQSPEEPCEGCDAGTPYFHIHLNPEGTHTVIKKAGQVNTSLQEKPPLADVPLNSEELAKIYNKEAPPPYEGDPLEQAVWSTDTSKLYPGSPRVVGGGNKLVNVLCRSLIVILSIVAGLYLCQGGVSTILENYETTDQIETASKEVNNAYNVVEDLDNIPAEYEGKLIYVTGPIIVNEPLQYPECNISVRSVKLKRIYDKTHAFTKRAYDEQYFFSDKWPTMRIDKDYICARPENNVQFTSPYFLDHYEQIADVVTIGSLQLGHRLKEKLDEYYFVAERVVQADDFTGYSVAYAAAGISGSVFSFMGKLENGSIEPYDSLDYYTIILQAESKVPPGEMISERVIHRLREIEADNRWAYMTIAIGGLVPVLGTLHLVSAITAMKKNKRNHLMLSMPVQ